MNIFIPADQQRISNLSPGSYSWRDSFQLEIKNLALYPNFYSLINLTAAVCWNRFVSWEEQFSERRLTPEMIEETSRFLGKGNRTNDERRSVS